MPSPQMDGATNNEEQGRATAPPPAAKHNDGDLTTAERSRVRQQMLQWERNRRLVEETEKLRRITCEKEEAKQKREEALVKKSLEEEAAMILAGDLSPAAKPFEPTTATKGATNDDKRRSRDVDDKEGGEQGESKKQGVGSPI